MSQLKTSGPLETYGIFGLGIFCAIAFRSLTILGEFSPGLVRPMWYAGVIGYFIFFFYRFRISSKRRNAVQKYNLMETLSKENSLSPDQKNAVMYLLGSITKSKENLNYYIIFMLSGLSIIIDLCCTYFGR